MLPFLPASCRSFLSVAASCLHPSLNPVSAGLFPGSVSEGIPLGHHLNAPVCVIWAFQPPEMTHPLWDSLPAYPPSFSYLMVIADDTGEGDKGRNAAQLSSCTLCPSCPGDQGQQAQGTMSFPNCSLHIPSWQAPERGFPASPGMCLWGLWQSID